MGLTQAAAFLYCLVAVSIADITLACFHAKHAAITVYEPLRALCALVTLS